ncbi:ribonuclease III [Auritidibacter ignavus]|uniref:ribonuclease III n=1 Tax=Auritidibacter ignavus TaxID=678932 RepID=UPI0024B9CB82|nr:ribonuclease III [Auritidibacter ignavus]WHS35102.1 ribonuclease III [Auritidibacter ignavus]
MTEDLTKHLGVHLGSEMLRLALTHRSYAFEKGGLPTNERLEFLGDAVLQIIVTDHLYRAFPDEDESQLAKKRSSIVSTVALARVGRSIGVGQHILLGEGETRTGGADKDSILADTMEALIGATYLEEGYEAARGLVHRYVIPLLDDDYVMGIGRDWKTLVQMEADSASLAPVEYRLSSRGPDHAREFTAELYVAEKKYGVGQAGSKKEAERLAAWDGYDALQKDIAQSA